MKTTPIFVTISIALVILLVDNSCQVNDFLKPESCSTGEMWFDGCNNCTCEHETPARDGICTEVFCPRPEPCGPGQAYFDGMNWCFCHSNPEKDVCMGLDI